MKTFPCISCGLCCKNVGIYLKLGNFKKDHPLYFPYKAKKDGSCSKLKNNLCTVYDNRPIVCNIEKLAGFLNVDIKEFYKANAEMCNIELEKAGRKERIII